MSSINKNYILILEDDESHAELIRRSFNATDPEKNVVFTSTLKDAKARISECLPRIAVADWNLGDGKGDEIIISPQVESAFPVIILTSYGSEAIAVAAMKKGALDYVVKSEETFSNLPHIIERTQSHWDEIRKRINTEKKLAKSEAEYKDLYDNAPDMFCSVDAKTRLVSNCNQTLAEKIGRTKEDIIGKPVFDLYNPSCMPEVEKYFKSIATTGVVKNAELQLRKKDGSFIDVILNVSSFRDQAGKILHSRSVWRDITEKKQVELELERSHEQLEKRVKERTAELEIAKNEAESADRLKSLFVASMSHELRTPLNSIIGFTSIILEGMAGEINPKQKDYLGRAHQSSKHLLGLISDIMDISKIEAGIIEAAPELFKLDKVVAQALDDSCIQKMKSKGLELKIEVPLNLEVYNDRKRFLQCLINFLSNAAKFTESGSIRVTAREVGGDIEVMVEDTGIGISEADLPKLFQQFERLDSPLKIKAGGTGLGLYLTKKLASEILGGSVSVESQLDVGSKFFLKFPKNLELERSK